MNKLTFTIMFIIISIGNILANDGYVIRQQSIVQVYPMYQSWATEDNNEFSETSIPLFIYFPVSRVFSLSMQTNQASVKGELLPQSLTGITDTQLSLNYYLESLNLVLNMGVNIPSGKKELNESEFLTSSFLSRNYWGMRVPNFGQGLNFSPGLTWALPLNDDIAFGIGISYQYKGAFKPYAEMENEYKPGNEFLFSGGLDLRLTETMSVAGDLIYIMYSKDKIEDREVFEAGKMTIVNFQLRKYFNYDELTLRFNFRTKAKNRLHVAGSFIEEPNKTSPNQSGFMAKYKHRFLDKYYTSFLLDFKNYEEVLNTPKIYILGVGIMPEISFSKNFIMPIRIKYLFGSITDASNITGIEMGLGFLYMF